MKKILFLQRILASLIDLMMVYLPTQFLLFILFKNRTSGQFGLSVLLFVLYNILGSMYFSGQTIGKYFARLKVIPVTKSMMEMGQREAVKILYFLPYAGFFFMGASVFVYIREGRFLHDKVGSSEVIFTGKH